MDMYWKTAKINEREYTYTYPEIKSENNFYRNGFFVENSACHDMRKYRYMEMEILSAGDMVLEIDFCFMADNSPQAEIERHGRRRLAVTGKGEKRISLDLSQLDIPAALENDYKFVRGFQIKGDKDFTLKSVTFKKGRAIALSCDILSKAVQEGETAVYPVTITNCTDKERSITFYIERQGWEVLEAALEEEFIKLLPWEERTVPVRVRMNERIVPGGYEKHHLVAVPEGRGNQAEKLTLVTSRYLPRPNMLMDEGELKKVREKMKVSHWAEEAAKLWEKLAAEWQVPEMEKEKNFLFESRQANWAKGSAIMYHVTGKKEYARKAADMLLQLADPAEGYLRLPHGCSQELVHEGEFFKQMAMVYDLIYDTEYFQEEDRKNIEAAFRLFMELMEESLTRGEISNWSLAEAVGALCCASALQDRERMERFLYGAGGITEHMSKGILSDGFWFECTIGYNLLAAGLFTEAAQMVGHFGINLADLWVPASYSRNIGFPKFQRDGLILEAWGPNTSSWRSISMLWDSLLPFFDYRGIIPGMNDSCEMKIPGIATALFDHRYDLAYYLYGKAEYAAAVKDLPPEERDLLFGCAEAPAGQREEYYKKSIYADNGGLALLRSQTEGREQRNQIQVALKYGCHGGAHGHYDRVSITGISRYGKSLYCPENIWYSYHTFMYKFYVQNSITHNMVTVDLKQQDPAEPKRNLFYSGKMLQACELENRSRWCNPPYGGWNVDTADFKERTWLEGKYVPVPKEHPAYMERTGFTEEVIQKRLTLVTDDYIVNFDYIKGGMEHQYDCIYHLKALKSLESERLKFSKHTEQLDTDPLGSGQFITDCDWYQAEGNTKLHFETYYDEEHNNGGKWLSPNRTAHNTPGSIQTDLYAVWPGRYDMVIGHPPEYDHMYKQLWYEVWLDGELKSSGNFGAWVLGKERIHLNISGSKTLSLAIKVKDVEFEANVMQYSKDNIFWGSPRLIRKDGRAVYLSELEAEYENTKKTPEAGKDYEGGPVKIQGEPMPMSIPAEPADRMREGRITLSLEGLEAEYFDSFVGADYPIGSEEDIRRSVFFRTRGKEARFTTLLELYESEPLIQEIEEAGANCLEVRLKDGRKQVITVHGLEQETGTQVSLEEYKDGKLVRQESAGIYGEE